MKRTTVYLHEELLLALKDIARRDGRTEADVIREGLSLYVESRKRPLPAFVASVEDDGFRAANDEEYLSEHWTPDW